VLGEVLLCVFVTNVMVFDALVFLVSYSSPLATYTGQEDDRAAAVRILLVLVTPGVLLIGVLLWVEIRRRRASTGGLLHATPVPDRAGNSGE
jgi:hypothetical protein